MDSFPARFDFLCSLLSYSISTHSTKLLEFGALWIKINEKKFALNIADSILEDFRHSQPPGGDMLKVITTIIKENITDLVHSVTFDLASICSNDDNDLGRKI